MPRESDEGSVGAEPRDRNQAETTGDNEVPDVVRHAQIVGRLAWELDLAQQEIEDNKATALKHLQDLGRGETWCSRR
jgi:hypothetical protein